MKPSDEMSPVEGNISRSPSNTSNLNADATPFVPAGKECGICLEQIGMKSSHELFGILENCAHVFCRQCIRTWRISKHWNAKKCPECRIYSSFVLSSRQWLEDDKKQIKISLRKQEMSILPCKHFDEGRGDCPYASNCLCLHLYPDGTEQDKSLLRTPREIILMGGQQQNDDFMDSNDDPVIIRHSLEPRDGASDGVSVHIYYPQLGRVEEIWTREQYLDYVLPYHLFDDEQPPH